MEFICKKCGEPVKNILDYEIFEGMHWICFHFEFEHGEYDRDEPCDDVACPWNRITGRDKQIILSQSEIKLQSEGKVCGIYFDFIEEELVYLPSKSFRISVLNESRSYYELENIWFEIEAISKFVEELKSISITGQGSANLQSMSPNEFVLEIENIDSKGHILVKYEIWKKRVEEYGRFDTKTEDGFLVNLAELDKFIAVLEL